MVLMEVNLLSGFTASTDSIPLSETLKKVESGPGKLSLYLDSVSRKPLLVKALGVVFRSLLPVKNSVIIISAFCL